MLLNEKNLLRKLSLCMTFAEQHPQLLKVIGIVWINNDEFIINTSICGKFININPNTINQNLLGHEFQARRMPDKNKYNFFQKMNQLELYEIHWTIRKRNGVTKDNLYEVAPLIPYVNKSKKQKQCESNLDINNQIQDHHNPNNDIIPEIDSDNAYLWDEKYSEFDLF